MLAEDSVIQKSPADLIKETDQSQGKERIFFPHLDGLRFLCFLSIFIYHSFATTYEPVLQHPVWRFVKDRLFYNFSIGVNFFFVLSGFLITYLLIVEKERLGSIKILPFYARRMLRIWPLFYLCVFFGFVIFPYFKSLFGMMPEEIAQWPYYVLFLNNLDFIHHYPDSSELAILWSIAIEEQFYLVWPLLLAFLPSRYYIKAFLIIIAGSFIFRYIYAADNFVLEFHTISCISDMTVGGMAATLIWYNKQFKDWIVNLDRKVIIFIYMNLIAVMFFKYYMFHINNLFLAIDRLYTSIVFIMIILEQCYAKNSLFKMGDLKLLSRLGTYTFGLYCLHMIGKLITAVFMVKFGLDKKLYAVLFLESSMSLAITMVLAYFSYHYYESWFLKLKHRFSRITK